MDVPEVYFCDLCNASIPEQDMAAGTAVRVRDKTVGACCVAQIRGSSAAERGGDAAGASAGRSGGAFAAAMVTLIAIAGATVFLDWRIGQESIGMGQRVEAANGSVAGLVDRLDAIESRMQQVLAQGALDPLAAQVDSVAQDLTAIEERIVGSVRGNATRLRDLGTAMQALDNGQRDHIARIAELHGELRRIAGRVDELIVVASTPMESAAALDPPVPVTEAVGEPVAEEDPDPDVLPPALLPFVEQLADADDGERFEAVDELLQSGDARVFPHVLPLASDPDPFVRRLVFEGLKDFRDPRGVDALIAALEDPESLVRYTAHASLRALTKQSLPFDPDASASKRASMVRRWGEWWEKSRADFF